MRNNCLGWPFYKPVEKCEEKPVFDRVRSHGSSNKGYNKQSPCVVLMSGSSLRSWIKGAHKFVAAIKFYFSPIKIKDNFNFRMKTCAFSVAIELSPKMAPTKHGITMTLIDFMTFGICICIDNGLIVKKGRTVYVRQCSLSSLASGILSWSPSKGHTKETQIGAHMHIRSFGCEKIDAKTRFQIILVIWWLVCVCVCMSLYGKPDWLVFREKLRFPCVRDTYAHRKVGRPTKSYLPLVIRWVFEGIDDAALVESQTEYGQEWNLWTILCPLSCLVTLTLIHMHLECMRPFPLSNWSELDSHAISSFPYICFARVFIS